MVSSGTAGCCYSTLHRPVTVKNKTRGHCREVGNVAFITKHKQGPYLRTGQHGPRPGAASSGGRQIFRKDFYCATSCTDKERIDLAGTLVSVDRVSIQVCIRNRRHSLLVYLRGSGKPYLVHVLK